MILNKTRNNNSFTIELHSFNSVDKNYITLDYLNWVNDLEVVRPIGSPILLEPKGKEFIDESYRRFTSKNCQGFFIKDLNDNKFIGTAKIDKIDLFNKSAEIGIMIGNKNKWGKGFATEVYRILTAYAFEELRLHRLWGGTNSNNTAMQKTFLKLGFKEEGILRKACLIDNEYVDIHLYSLLDREYFS